MVQMVDGRDFVVADMPGLIEGAASGAGLGIEFLRHIERTRVLLHLIDMSGFEGREPYEDYLAINKELESYDLRLLERPQILVATKMDMPASRENLEKFKHQLADGGEKVELVALSALTKTGLDELLTKTAALLAVTPDFPLYEIDEAASEAYYGFTDENAPSFQASRDFEGTWIVTGEKIERLVKMTNLDHDESIMKLARQMRAMGIDEALRAKGAQNNDLVRIGKFEFEFVD
jgi:GTP-binding protein